MGEAFECESASLPPPITYEVGATRARTLWMRYDVFAVALAGAIGLVIGFLLGAGVGG